MSDSLWSHELQHTRPPCPSPTAGVYPNPCPLSPPTMVDPSKVQFSSVQLLSHVRLFVTPWIAACQASLSNTNSRSSLRLTSIESVMPSSHLLLCCPFLLLSSSSLSAIRVVSSAYLRLLIFPPAILSPVCASSSLAFRMMFSAEKLNKQGGNIQPCHTPFPIWNQSVVTCRVLIVASWPAHRFLRRQVRWSDIPFSWRIFHSLLWSAQSKGFSVVNEAEEDVFLEFSCFFYDPTDVDNLISGSSAFSKSSLYICKFSVHVLLKPSLKDLSITLLTCEMSTIVSHIPNT